MNQLHLQSLLRRTAVAIAATATSLLALPAGAALTMTLPNSVVCTSPTITTQPDGTLMLTCGAVGGGGGGGTGAPPPPATPSVSISAPSTIAAGTTATVSINATAAPASSVAVGVHITGTGCNWNGFPAPANGQYTFSPSLASVSISVGAPASGSCGVSIDTANASVLALGSPNSVSMTVGTTTTQPPPPPPPPPTGGSSTTGASYGVTTLINTASYQPGLTGMAVPQVSGCTPDPTTRMAGLPYPRGPYLGPPNTSLTAGSDVVTSFPLYGLGQFGQNAAQVAFGEVSGISAPSLMDISISTCPGVINTAVNDACNIHGITITNGLTFGWANNSTTANNNGECFAPETAQYYFNVRWHYSSSSCASGNNCGWSVNVN